MKTTNVYIRKTDASAIEVDSNNRPARSVVAIHRNEPLILAIHVFDGTASTQMTQVQLAAIAAAWNLNIAPSPNMTGPLCLQSTSATVGADGTISVIVQETDTVQAASEIGNATRAIWTAELTGTPGDSEQPSMVLQWRIAYINRVASENEPPPEAETNNYYPRPVIDAKFAAVGASIPAATTIARGTIQLATGDEVIAGINTAKAVVPSTLKTELDKKENTANKATDFAVIDDDKFPTVKAVKNFAQNETLAELTGSSVTVAPWTQTKYTAGGVCTITATGWALSGFQWSQIVITVLADATPAIAGTEEVSEDDALSEAGVYHAAFINLDGKVYFHVSSFVPAEVEE